MDTLQQSVCFHLGLPWPFGAGVETCSPTLPWLGPSSILSAIPRITCHQGLLCRTAWVADVDSSCNWMATPVNGFLAVTDLGICVVHLLNWWFRPESVVRSANHVCQIHTFLLMNRVCSRFTLYCPGLVGKDLLHNICVVHLLNWWFRPESVVRSANHVCQIHTFLLMNRVCSRFTLYCPGLVGKDLLHSLQSQMTLTEVLSSC